MSQNGTIHITMMKNWVSNILFLRKGGLSYTSPADKGLDLDLWYIEIILADYDSQHLQTSQSS